MKTRRRVITLIEDSSHSADIIIKVLKGYEVRHLQSSLENLSIEPASDLIIIDLPEIDGFEFLSAVKKNYPNYPIIVITGYSSDELCLKAFRFRDNQLFHKTIFLKRIK